MKPSSFDGGGRGSGGAGTGESAGESGRRVQPLGQRRPRSRTLTSCLRGHHSRRRAQGEAHLQPCDRSYLLACRLAAVGPQSPNLEGVHKLAEPGAGPGWSEVSDESGCTRGPGEGDPPLPRRLLPAWGPLQRII